MRPKCTVTYIYVFIHIVKSMCHVIPVTVQLYNTAIQLLSGWCIAILHTSPYILVIKIIKNRPHDEVWGKVMFSQSCVFLSEMGGCLLSELPSWGWGSPSWEVSPVWGRRCLVCGRGVWSGGWLGLSLKEGSGSGVGTVESDPPSTPQNGSCRGR